jgi:hypothetical protein
MAVKKIEDAGIKIGGARKDWRDRNMVIEDLADLTTEERVSLVKKDTVWPKPDYAALVAAGMPKEVAACVKALRDALAASPSKSGAKTVEEAQEGYITMLSAIRDKFLSARTMEELKASYGALERDFGGKENLRKHPTSAIWFSVYGKTTCPFVLNQNAMKKARALLATGFPEDAPAWKKNVTFFAAKGGHFCYKGNTLIGHFDTHEAAFEILKQQYEAAEANKKKKSKEKTGPQKPPARAHLDIVERDGMTDHRGSRDIDPQEFIDAFGFRGVEFGNWVPNDERQRMLNLGYDGMMDLAEILGWEPRDMSLGGRLSAAFGARGKGGRGAAHYEAGRYVYNFTRFNGAGSQAHEFGHALDHFVGNGTTVVGLDGVPSATGWRHRLVKSTRTILSHRDPELAETWHAVIHALDNTAIPQEEAAEKVRKAIAHWETNIADKRRQLEEAASRGDSTDLWQTSLASFEEKLALAQARLEKVLASSPSDDFGSRRSSFFTEALNISGADGYEARPNEMFARAFECYISDEIEARGGLSQYLVAGVEEYLYADKEMWAGNPYPTGAERENFRVLFQKAMAATLPLIESVRDHEVPLAM